MKRFFTTLLVLILALSFLPLTALAAYTTEDEYDPDVYGSDYLQDEVFDEDEVLDESEYDSVIDQDFEYDDYLELLENDLELYSVGRTYLESNIMAASRNGVISHPQNGSFVLDGRAFSRGLTTTPTTSAGLIGWNAQSGNATFNIGGLGVTRLEGLFGRVNGFVTNATLTITAQDGRLLGGFSIQDNIMAVPVDVAIPAGVTSIRIVFRYEGHGSAFSPLSVGFADAFLSVGTGQETHPRPFNTLFLENEIISTSRSGVNRFPQGGSFLLGGVNHFRGLTVEPTPEAGWTGSWERIGSATYSVVGRGVTRLRGTFGHVGGALHNATMVITGDDRHLATIVLPGGSATVPVNVHIPAGITEVRVEMRAQGDGSLASPLSVGFADAFFETVPLTPQRPGVEAFVRRIFQHVLNRADDPAGLHYWTSHLMNDTRTPGEVAFGFVFSNEFASRNTTNAQFVDVLYRTFMDRAGDPHGRNYWINRLNTGTSRIEVFTRFVNSVEFTEIVWQTGLTPTTFTPAADAHAREFVRRLFRLTLQREPDAIGLEYWVSHMMAGRRTGTQVGNGFIFSIEMNARNLNNTQFVNILYDAFMGRPADVAGRNYWLARMNAGMTRQQVFQGFASSAEFARIAASYSIQR